MNFGDKIQYPYSFPLEFAQQKSTGDKKEEPSEANNWGEPLPSGMLRAPSLVYANPHFNGNNHGIKIPNIERFNAKSTEFADGLTDKEMNFGDKIQYPYGYPLEFQ